MAIEVLECCFGKTVNHMGYGRCGPDQGGRTTELKIEISGEADEVILIDGEEHPVWVLDPCHAAMSCINMMDCLMTSDPCGEQVDCMPFGIRHLREDPCEPGRGLLQLCDVDGPIAELDEPLCLWIRVYGS